MQPLFATNSIEQDRIESELAKEREQQQLERLRKQRESEQSQQNEDIEIPLEDLEPKPENSSHD